MNLENDKKIAIFMGEDMETVIVPMLGHHYPSVEEMQFDASWDWLMPVVKKIESFRHSTDYPPEMRAHWLEISGSLLRCDLPATYRACIAFIDWYNAAEENLIN